MVQALRAQSEAESGHVGFRVLWLGTTPPPKSLTRIFEDRGYALVREGGEEAPPPLRVASLDIGPAPGRGARRSLAGRRVAVAHSDPGVADGMAQTVRALGATAAVVSLSELGLSRIGALQPHVVLFDPQDLEGSGFGLMLGVWADRLLRWTPVLLTPAACFDATGSTDFQKMVRSVGILGDRADALVERAKKESCFEVALSEHGPVLTLRALVESGHALSARFRTPDVHIQVDVAEGIVVGAQRHGDRSQVLGPLALAVLTDQLTGRVRVERRDRPATTNIMAPLETALSAASSERTSLLPPANPSAKAPRPAVSSATPLASARPPGSAPDEEEEEVTQVARPQDIVPTTLEKAVRQSTLLGMPAVTPQAAAAAQAGEPNASAQTAGGLLPAPGQGVRAYAPPPAKSLARLATTAARPENDAGNDYDWDTSPTEAPAAPPGPEAERPSLGDRLKTFGDALEGLELGRKLRGAWTRVRAWRFAPLAGAGVLVLLGIWIGSSGLSEQDTPSPVAARVAATATALPSDLAADRAPLDERRASNTNSGVRRARPPAPAQEAKSQVEAQPAPVAKEDGKAEKQPESDLSDDSEQAVPVEQGAVREADASEPPSRGERASDLVHEGNRHLQAKHYRPARNAFIQALKLIHGYPRAMEGMVHVYIATHDSKRALKMARGLVRRRPGRARHHRLLGDAYALNGDIANAQRAWKRAAAKGDRLAQKRLGR